MRLQRKIMHLTLFLLFPYFMFLTLGRKRETGTDLDDIAALNLLLLDGRRQLQSGFCLTLRVLRFDKHLVTHHQELIYVFLIYC